MIGQRLHLDIETRSRCDLKKTGMYRYAEDESTSILCAGYAFDNGPVHVWIPRKRVPLEVEKAILARLEPKANLWIRESVPRDLRGHIESDAETAAHNAAFERVVLNTSPFTRTYLGFPKLSIEQMICTAAKSSAHGLQRALENVSGALGTHPKDKAGQNDMRYLCKPRSDGTFAEPEDEPERWINLVLYNIDDVKAERAVDQALPELTKSEMLIYQMDQRMNDRGVKADLVAIGHVQYLIEQHKAGMEKRCREMTLEDTLDGPQSLSPTQTAKIADWIRARGIPHLPDMQADTILQILKESETPENQQARTLLKLYSTYAMKAVTKYTAIENSVCRDGRLRGMFIHYGAGPGRWSAIIVQPQNLFRPVILDPEVAIDAMAARDLDWLRALYPGIDPMKVMASCVRGHLVAEEGHDLIGVDFSSVEARFRDWIAGEEYKLEIYRTHGKVYQTMAALMFGVPMESIKKTDKIYTAGKIADLAFGFQGGVAAFMKMAKNYQLDATEEEAEQYKRQWRELNPNVVRCWYNLESAAKQAVLNPGKIYEIPGGKIKFKVVDYKGCRWLVLRLPSGRLIWYFKPGFDSDEEKVTYMGIDTHTRQWSRVSAYGGKFMQNITEGGCRDFLTDGTLRLEKKGYPPIMLVHDEDVVEIPKDFGSVKEAEETLTRPLPDYALDFPLGAEGFRAKRYRK